MTSILRSVLSSEDIARSILSVRIGLDYRLSRASQSCPCDTYEDKDALDPDLTRRAIRRLVSDTMGVFESYRVDEDSEDPPVMVTASRPLEEIWYDDLVDSDGCVVPSAAGIALLLGTLPNLGDFEAKDEFLSHSSVFPITYRYTDYILRLGRAGQNGRCSAVGIQEASGAGLMRTLCSVCLVRVSSRPTTHFLGFAQLESRPRTRVVLETYVRCRPRSSRWWAY